MHRADPELAIATDDGLAMFRLPYGDDERFGMEVLLPDGDVPLDELLSELNLDVRQELGIVSAFGRGDFTPRSSANPWLDAVMQTTYLRIDEGGTEAEAVTGGVMDESGAHRRCSWTGRSRSPSAPARPARSCCWVPCTTHAPDHRSLAWPPRR